MTSRAWISCVCSAVALIGVAATANTEPTRVHVEVDPLPFIMSGYGVQVGVAPGALNGWRFGLGNFSLEVPDFVAQLNGENDGFHLKVRRSHALYGLYFFDRLKGWCVGGSLRYLRLEYTHDDAPGERARVGEFSVEAIAGYKWHPTSKGFYVMPWLAVAKPLFTRGTAQVGSSTYETDFVQLFATANLGWQF